MNPLISPKSTNSESHESLLNEWMLTCRQNKRLHNEASKYYKRYADTSTLSAIILGSTSCILSIGIGVIEPISFVAVNIAKTFLRMVGLASTVAHKLDAACKIGATRV